MRTFSKKMVGGLAVSAAVAFGGAGVANAEFLLTAADIDANRSGVTGTNIPTPLIDKNRIDMADAFTYTNTYGAVNLTTLNVRTIVAGTIANVAAPSVSPILGPGNELFDIVVFAVIDGTVNTTTGTATYTTGSIGAFRNTTTDNFQPDDPTSWTLFTDGSEAFATWSLAAPTNIVTDNGFGVNFAGGVDASIVNTASVNVLSQNETQGRFLFLESSPDGAAPGDDFISIVNNLFNGAVLQNGIAPGAISNPNTSVDPSLVQAEGLYIVTEDNFLSDQSISDTDLDKLNDIGLWGAGALSGHPGIGFATGLGVALSDFNLDSEPSISGDFIALSDPDVFPGVLSAVPEPATLSLLALGGLGLLARRRRMA